MTKDAMPWLHRYIGNPVLSFILRFLFKTKVKDSHCGIRAIRKEALDRLNLVSPGMEFASEMIIKAVGNNLKIKEVPVSYKARVGESKLRSFNDGWKHLRFMLLYSPNYLFLLPGFLMFALGLGLVVSLLWGPVYVGNVLIDIHPMVLGSLLSIIGFQVLSFGFYAKTYAITHQLSKNNRMMNFLHKNINLEKGIVIGGIVLLLGLLLNINIFLGWIVSGFGGLTKLRVAIFASTLMIIGVQIVFSAFFLSILGIKEK